VDRDQANGRDLVAHLLRRLPLVEDDLQLDVGGWRCSGGGERDEQSGDPDPNDRTVTVRPIPYPRSTMTEVEMCWRCPTPMAWVQSTWQCPRCHFKLGCCEGEPQNCTDLAPEPVPVETARG
jgi:hypothetical protein